MTLFGRAEGWWAGAAVEEGIGDYIEFDRCGSGGVGGGAGGRRRRSGESDGDEGFGFLDAGVGEIAYFGLDPGALFGVWGEDDDAGVGLVEAGVDAGDDVGGGGDFLLVEPGVDALARRASAKGGRRVYRRRSG